MPAQTNEKIAALLATAKGDVLLTVKRSPFSIISSIFPALIILLVISLVYHLLFEYIAPIPVLRDLSGLKLGVILLVFVLEMIRRRYNDLYVIETHRVTHMGGRLGLRYMVPAVKYIDMRAIVVRRDVMGRIFNYGDILIGTAASRHYEMTMTGIADPDNLGMLIDDLRNYDSANLQSAGTTTAQQAINDFE